MKQISVMVKFMLSCLAVVLVMTGCREYDLDNVPSKQEDVQQFMDVKVQLNNSYSRAVVDQSNLTKQKFTLFGEVMSPGNSWQNAFEDIVLSYSDSKWMLSSPTAWSFNSQYRFTATYPTIGYKYDSGIVMLAAIPAVQSVADGVDYLVSDGYLTGTVTQAVVDKGITLNMRHILSQISLEVNNKSAYDINVKSAKLSLPTYAMASFEQTSSLGEELTGEWTWENFTNSIRYNPAEYTDIPVKNNGLTHFSLSKNSGQASSDTYFIAPNNGEPTNLFYSLEYEILDEQGNVKDVVSLENVLFKVTNESGVHNVVYVDIEVNPEDMTESIYIPHDGIKVAAWVNNRLDMKDCEYPSIDIDKKWNKFIIQAHRGKLNTHPENSWAAFEAAVETGFNCTETDIRWTKDNVPILFHDDKIDRISNGTGVPSNMTLAQLQQYSYHCPEQFGDKYYPTSLLTAEEYLLKCKAGGYLCELDLAGRVVDINQLNDLVKLVKKCGMLESTMLKLIPEDIEKMDKSIPIFVGVSTAMTRRPLDSVIEAAADYEKWAMKVAISLGNLDVTKNRISRIHELGMLAQSWVYIPEWDTVEKMEEFKEMGLDIYMTDDLDIMTKYRAYLKRKQLGLL